MIGTAINRLLRPFGLRMTRLRKKTWRSVDAALECNTLIDIGCAYGTPEFYALNEHAFLFLIDALEEYQPSIKSILSQRSGEYVIAALDATEKTIELNVCPRDPKKSTAHTRSTKQYTYVPRIVKTRTLDSIVKEHRPPAPYGIKIDVEGHEPEVICGATETLKDACFVIMETTVRKRFQGGYRFLDIVTQMDALGFDLSDIIDAPKNASGYFGYLDLLYLNRNRSYART